MFILTDGKDIVVPLKNLSQLRTKVCSMVAGKYELYEVAMITGAELDSVLHIEVFEDHSLTCIMS